MNTKARDLTVSFLRAAAVAAADPSRFSDARLYAVELLRILKVKPSASPLKPVRNPQPLAKAQSFAANPCSRTFSAWVAASVSAERRLLDANNKHRASLPGIDKTAPLPDPTPRPVKQTCATSLEWQTKPAIGTNPMLVTMLRELSSDDKKRKAKLSSDDKKQKAKLSPDDKKPAKPRRLADYQAPIPAIQPARPHCRTTAPKLSLRAR